MLLSEVNESCANTGFFEFNSPFAHGRYLQREKRNEKIYYQGERKMKPFGQ